MNSKQVIASWEECLNSANLNNLVDLYSQNAVLWGTFSKVIRNNSDLIREYFQELFKKRDLKVSFNASFNRVYDDTHLYSGTYKFSYINKELIIINARYTFVVCKHSNDIYKIVEHHSSVIPD